jgi:hypothetical protein
VPTKLGANVMTWLETITGPLGTVTKGLQELMEVRDLVKFGDTFRKMHSDVLAAQSSALAGYTRELTLLDEIGQLKKRVAEFETWNTQKQRYELKFLGYGAYAYMLKPDARGTEPPHWACTNCYEHGHIVTIQYGVLKRGDGHAWFCPSCHNTVMPSHEGLGPAGKPKWLD